MAVTQSDNNQRGILIAFDGIDSSGKETQAKLLAQRLRYQGHNVLEFTTPDYNTDSGREIKLRLQNKLDKWEETSWEDKMRLFVRNRSENKDKVIAALKKGEIVIYDRYVGSSLTFFTIDACSPQEINIKRQEIQQKIADTEYVETGMPHEDISIFLDLPPRDAARLLEKRKSNLGDEDEFTDHLEVQERLYNEYDILINQDPNRFLRVKCITGDRLLSVDDIGELVWQGLISRFPRLHA
jgi:dTMP kinase